MKFKHLRDRVITTGIAVAAIAMTAATPSCMNYKKSDNSHTTGTMTLICDQSFENIMNLEIDVFEYQYPEAHVLANYAPQNVVLDSLMSLNTKTVIMARDITKREREILHNKGKQVRSSKIAVDAIALIVNNDNTCSKLTLKEVADILAGRTTRWNDLEPSELGDIAVTFDNQGSSLVSYMRDSLLNGAPLGANVYAQGSPQKVFEAVQKNKNAIGVIGVSWLTSDLSSADMSTPGDSAAPVSGEASGAKSEAAADSAFARKMLGDEPVQGVGSLSNKVKVLKIYGKEGVEAYKPYQEYIFNGKYPLFRQIYMVTTGVNGSLEVGFYAFVTGDTGQKIIMQTGILPARVKIQVVELGGGS